MPRTMPVYNGGAEWGQQSAPSAAGNPAGFLGFLTQALPIPQLFNPEAFPSATGSPGLLASTPLQGSGNAMQMPTPGLLTAGSGSSGGGFSKAMHGPIPQVVQPKAVHASVPGLLSAAMGNANAPFGWYQQAVQPVPNQFIHAQSSKAEAYNTSALAALAAQAQIQADAETETKKQLEVATLEALRMATLEALRVQQETQSDVAVAVASTSRGAPQDPSRGKANAAQAQSMESIHQKLMGESRPSRPGKSSSHKPQSRVSKSSAQWRCTPAGTVGHRIRGQASVNSEMVGEIKSGETVVGRVTADGEWLQLANGFSLLKQGERRFFEKVQDVVDRLPETTTAQRQKIKVGDVVQYLSQAQQKWFVSRVTAIRHGEDGGIVAYDLDAKSGAKVDRVRPAPAGTKLNAKASKAGVSRSATSKGQPPALARHAVDSQLSAGTPAAGSSSTASFKVGDRVVYWSKVKSQWLKASVKAERLKGDVLTYDLSCFGFVVNGCPVERMQHRDLKRHAEGDVAHTDAKRVRKARDATPAKPAAPAVAEAQSHARVFAVGDKVRYWSATHNKWVLTGVKKVNLRASGELKSYDLDLKPKAPTWMVKPTSHPKDAPAPIAPKAAPAEDAAGVPPDSATAENAGYRVGSTVEYWSKKTSAWIKARVKGKREENGLTLYELACKTMAVNDVPAERMRTRPVDV